MAQNRVVLTLVCGTCKNKNYYFAVGRKKEKKVEVKKFCKACDKHTPHKESKAS